MATEKKVRVKKVTVPKEAPVTEENINISIEQICAGMINTYKTVVVPMDNLLKDYSKMSIAVNQDEETKILTFTLVNNPEVEETQEEDQVES